MLEPPALEKERIIDCLRDQYRLGIVEVTFFTLGADANTAGYRGVAVDGKPYFLKLRSGVFEEISVMLPGFLHGQFIRHTIPTRGPSKWWDRLWGKLDAFAVLLSPFIEGENGWEVDLTDDQWVEFGKTL